MTSNVCSDPCDVRGRALPGAVLTLDAIGPQDNTYMLSNDSSFLPAFTKSPSDAIFQRQTPFGQTETTYFGNTVKHVFKTKEMGDLLGNMYLKTKLPVLSENQAASETVIELPGEFTTTINPSEQVCFDNDEIRRISFPSPPTEILYQSLVGQSNNQNLSNTQFTGFATSESNISIGYVDMYNHTLGTNLFTDQVFSTVDPASNFKLSANVSVYEDTVQNPATIEGGVRNFEFSDLNRSSKNSFIVQPQNPNGSFSYLEKELFSIDDTAVYSNLVGNSVTLPRDGTTTVVDQMAIMSVTSNLGTKFLFSNVNFEVQNLEFFTNVVRTEETNVLLADLPTHSFGSNVMVSNVVIDANQTITDGANIFSAGDDFRIQYHSEGEFSNLFGGANVVVARGGLITNKITIRESDDIYADFYGEDRFFNYRRNMLYRVGYSATPTTDTLVNVDDIEPQADTISLYSNSQELYTLTSLQDIPLDEEIVTPPGAFFKEIYVSNVSADANNYVLDGSFQPIVEITSPARNTTVSFGVRQTGTNTYLHYLVGFRQNSPTFVSAIADTTLRSTNYSTDPADDDFVRFSVGRGWIPEAAQSLVSTPSFFSSGSQLFGAVNSEPGNNGINRCRIVSGSNVNPESSSGYFSIEDDHDFMNALRHGGLIIKRKADFVLEANVSVSFPKLEMFIGTSKFDVDFDVNVYSNTTTVEYSQNGDFTITNGSNNYSNNLTTITPGITQTEFDRILYGPGTHLSVQSNVFARTLCPGPGTPFNSFSNIFITPSQYENTIFTESSNGYANVIANNIEYGPINMSDSELVAKFLSNTTTGYTEVANVYTDYYSNIFTRSSISDETIEALVDPFRTRPQSEGALGNVYTQTVDNFVELDGIVGPTSEKFGETGYDVYWDLQWPGSNVVTIKTYDGPFDNRVTNNIFSNVLTTPFTVAGDIETFSYGESLVQFTNTSVQHVGSDYPMSFVSITLSTGERLPITYDSSNVYYQKAELFQPREFSNTSLTGQYFGITGTSFYSGPSTLTINTDNIQEITGTTSHNSNVVFTRAYTNVHVNDVDVANVSVPTYDPRVFVELTTFPNVITVTSNTGVSMSNSLPQSEYQRFLRSNTLSFNDNLYLGDSNLASYSVDFFQSFDSAAFFGYQSNLYVFGGNYDGTPSNRGFKYDASNSLTSNTITIGSFPINMTNGRAVLDDDNFNVYLFGANEPDKPASERGKLYKVGFNPTTHTIQGTWTVDSASFPGSQNNLVNMAYKNNRVVIIGGTEAYYYDIANRNWNAITLSEPISSTGGTGTLAVANKIYFMDSGTKIKYLDSSNNYFVHTITDDSSVGDTTFTNFLVNYEYSTFLNRLYIIGGQRSGAKVQYIDVATDTRFGSDNTSNVTDQGLTSFASIYDTVNTRRIVTLGGNNGQELSNIFMYDTLFDEWYDFTLNLIIQRPLYNAPFVGATSPGNIPIIRSGYRFKSQKTPMVTVSETLSSNTLEIGYNRSNIYTAIPGSDRVNKGIFANWYVDIKNSSGLVSNVAWNGKDYGGNFSQDYDGTQSGPVWFGDALNTSAGLANTYISNIHFESTGNLENTYMRFDTTLQSGDTDPRAVVVKSNVATWNVEYSNTNFMNTFFDYTVNGLVPFTSANNNQTCITNNFNPFISGNFNGYPPVTVTTSTDNIPTTIWYFTESGGVVTPPGNPPDTSNTIVNDAYRQYIPSKLTRSGRLDKLKFFYGMSRFTLPNGPTQAANTRDFGVFRDDVYTGAKMLGRKLTLASFAPKGQESNPDAHLEIYKYFASNVGYSASVNTTERGWWDEVIVSFGSDITQSGNKEILTINPGYGTDPVQNGNGPITDALQPEDTIEVFFENYDPSTLSVTSNIVYNSSVFPRIVFNERTFALKASMFNALNDSFGRSGDMVICTTHNSGLVTSNLSYGERPVSGVNLQPSEFSSNLLRTCLSTFNQGTDRDNSSDYIAQQNVFESVFPVKININKYNANGIYTDKIGRAIIDEITFDIGGQEIETLNDLWYVTRDEFFRTDDEKDSLKFLINGGQDYLPSSPVNYGPIDLYIPLDFFFCRTRKTSSTQSVPKRAYDEYRSQKPYLPVCALTDQDITITIKFNPQTYFSNTTSTIDLSFAETFLITEEVYVKPEERQFYKSQPQQLLIENVHRLPRQLMQVGNDVRFEGLVMDMPLKLLTWLFRARQFEDKTDSTEFLHRYNFSTVRSENERYKLFYELLKKANFYFEGVPLVERYGTPNFYKYYQGLKSDLTATEKNIYSYAFSLDPSRMDPSGSVNLSESSSNKTFFTFDLELKPTSTAIEEVDADQGFTLHSFGYGYNLLRIEDGRATISFV